MTPGPNPLYFTAPRLCWICGKQLLPDGTCPAFQSTPPAIEQLDEALPRAGGPDYQKLAQTIRDSAKGTYL